jgi:predicted 2-oxoglutarate/Fe(II)-dependent dioxygenase YbiX
MSIFRIKNALSHEECEVALQFFEKNRSISTKTEALPRQIRNIGRMELCPIMQRVLRKQRALVVKANEVYQFDISNAEASECNLFFYEKGDFGEAHNDCAPPYANTKSVIVTLLNSSTDFDGGEVDFFDIAKKENISLVNIGDTIVFPAYITHAITKVTRGERKVLASFFDGPTPYR